ncbi:Nudix hydrolase 3 [Phytophthora boehmeriae]|uniref:RxLR effector protein n=1 Tax=Phytophthora boehmeriae TaxID=109152 RepID=A0A8T1VLZ1_9STRA|nr:Nudix hydrolase 3 [Phytophthora boehmeriae]
MRLNFVLTIVAIAFFATCRAIDDDRAKDTKVTAADFIATVQDIGTRFLRGGEAVDYENETFVEGLATKVEGEEEEEKALPKLKFRTKWYGPQRGTLIDDAVEGTYTREAARAAAAKDAVNKNRLKLSPSGLRREVLNGGVPRAVSRVGRDKQRYSKDGRKLMSCTVVSHPTKKGADVLLISSSGTKGKWVLPKGGWEKDETITASARREVLEEGGVKGTLMADLGKISFGSHKTGKEDKRYRYYGFYMKANKIVKKEDWSENSRTRKFG